MQNRKMKLLLNLVSCVAVLCASAVAFAQEAGPLELTRAGNNGWIALASGLAIGLAAFGGGLAQGRASAAALDGIARNPGASGKIFIPMILGLVLIESLVIYAFAISFLLYGKIS